MNVHPKQGKLAVQLYENTLTGRKDDYSARVLLRGSVDTRHLAEIIASDTSVSGTALSAEQITGICNRVMDLAADYLADGFSVRLGLCTAMPSVNGVFTGSGASFDPERHTLSVSFVTSRALREALKLVSVEVAGLARTGSAINRILDVKTGEENGRVTVGRNLKLFGIRLTVQGSDEQVGVWFINADDETKRVRVDPSDIVDNHPSQITVIVPPLESGEWYVELVTQSTPNKDVFLKEARSCRYELPLFVE